MNVNPFSLNELKEAIRDTLRIYLYPQSTASASNVEVTLSTNTEIIKVAQSFKPFSKCYSSVSPYRYTISTDIKLKKVGTPDGNFIVSLQSSNNDEPSGTTISSFTIAVADVATTMSVETGNLALTNMLGSNTRYWLVEDPDCTASTVNFYVTEKSSLDTYYGGSLITYSGSSWSTDTGDLYFDLNVPNFIYGDYPRSELNKHSFPRLALDMISRRFEQRWINTEFGDYYLDFTLVCYSAYPQELDEILSYCDRIIFKQRAVFDNMIRVDPGELTPVVVVSEGLYSRALRYTIRFRMTAQ